MNRPEMISANQTAVVLDMLETRLGENRIRSAQAPHKSLDEFLDSIEPLDPPTKC